MKHQSIIKNSSKYEEEINKTIHLLCKELEPYIEKEKEGIKPGETSWKEIQNMLKEKIR